MTEPKRARVILETNAALGWPELLTRACEALKSEPQRERRMVLAWLEAMQQKEAVE